MQFNLALLSGAGRAPGNAPRDVLLPNLLQALQATPGSATLRAEGLEDQHERRSRRADQRRDDLVHGGSSSAAANEVLADAERSIRPGSRAFRRQQLRDQAQARADRPQQAFRRELNQATQRRQPSAAEKPAQSDAAGATQTKARAGTDVGQATPGRPAASGHASTNQPRIAVLLPAGDQGSAQSPGSRSAKPNQTIGRVVATGGVSAAAAAKTSVPVGNGALRGGGDVPGGVVSTRSTAGSSKTGTQRAALPETVSEGKSDANIARILRAVQARIGRTRSVATLHLDPPELGKVRLRMELRDDSLTLRIDTQSGAARRLLAHQLDALRQGLEAAGIQLERVELRTPHPAPSGAESDSPQHHGLPAGQQEQSSGADDQAAGGGERHGTDAIPDQPELEPAPNDILEPAAESLVNVLA